MEFNAVEVQNRAHVNLSWLPAATDQAPLYIGFYLLSAPPDVGLIVRPTSSSLFQLTLIPKVTCLKIMVSILHRSLHLNGFFSFNETNGFPIANVHRKHINFYFCPHRCILTGDSITIHSPSWICMK